MIRLLPLVLACAALTVFAGTAPARPAAKHCGLTARIRGERMDIIESTGHASCRTVKRVMTHYLRTFEFKRPWFCALTHNNQFPWDASCATKHVVVRAYSPN
jgi:hypothetical protein